LNLKCKNLKVSIVFALLLFHFGCRSLSETKRQFDIAGTGETAAPKNPFARVSPRELDKNLTDEQLEKMFVSLDKVPLGKVKLEEGLPSAPPPQSTDQSQDPNALTEGKAYLRARWLLKKAEHLNRNELSQQALEELYKGLAADPNCAPLMHLLAQTYFVTGKEDEALASCSRALRLNPDNMDSYYILAVIRYNQGEYMQSASALKRALQCPQAVENNPATALTHLLWARSLEELGYLAAASKEYRSAWRLFINHRHYAHSSLATSRLITQPHIPLLALAGLQLKMGHIDQTIAALNQAQSLLTEKQDLVELFVLTLTKQKIPLQQRYQQVMVLSRYLLSTQVDQERSVAIFFTACADMAMYKSYLQELDKWREIKFQGTSLLSSRLYAYGLSRADLNAQAEKILVDIQAKDKSGLVQRDLARLYAKTHQWLKMIKSLGAYAQISPRNTDMALQEMEKSSIHIQDLTDKLNKWQHDETINTSAGSCFLLGYLARAQKKDDLAETFFRCCLAVKPDFNNARNRLIELLLDHNRYREVLTFLEQMEAGPEKIRFAGRAHLGLGNLEQAGRFFHELIELQKDDVEAYLSLSEVLYKQNAFARAEEILLQVLDQWPDRRDVYRRLLLLYIRWSIQPSLNEQLLEAAQNRSQYMLRGWLKYKPVSPSLKQEAAVQNNLLLQELLELAREYPRTRTIGLSLTQLYENQARMKKAFRQVEKLLEVYPEDKEVLLQAASLYEKKKDLKQAARLREKLWRNHPWEPQMLLGCLQTWDKAGEPQTALKILLEAAQQESWHNDPEVVKVLHKQALRLFMVTRRYGDSVKLFEKWYYLVLTAAQQGRLPKDSDILRQTADDLLWSLVRAGYYQRARLYAVAFCREYDSQIIYPILGLVHTYNALLEFDRSISLLDELIYLQPEEPAFRIARYLVLLRLGQKAQALTDSRKWLAEKPDDKKRIIMVASVMSRLNEYKEAVALLDKALAITPQDEGLQLQLINALLKAGEYDRAEKMISGHKLEDIYKDSPWMDAWIKLDIIRQDCLQALNRVSQFVGTDSNAIYVRQLKARILDICGQTDKAAQRQEQIIEQDPCDLEARLQYSLYLDRLGQTQKAAEQLEFIHKKHPRDSGIMNNLAYLWIQADQHIDRAENLLLDSLKIDPDSGPTLDSFGWLYYKKGDFKTALEYIVQAAALMVLPDPEVLDHLGDVVYRLGQKDKALAYWQWAQEKLQRKLPTERFLQKNIDNIKNKIQQLKQGDEVVVTPLIKENQKTKQKNEPNLK